MSEKKSNYMIEKVGIDYQECRSHKRAVKTLPACLSFGGHGRLADCVVLNISATGARVKFDKALGDAEDVNTRFKPRLKVAAAADFPVEVVWQNGPEVGLRFLSDPCEVAVVLEKVLPPAFGWFNEVEQKAD